MSSTSLGTLSPRIVSKFSVLGSTATATVCKAHNTGNIVVIAAGSKRGLSGPVVGFHMRKRVDRPAGAPGFISKTACVRLFGRTMGGSNDPSILCDRSGVGNAHVGLGPCIFPSIG